VLVEVVQRMAAAAAVLVVINLAVWLSQVQPITPLLLEQAALVVPIKQIMVPMGQTAFLVLLHLRVVVAVRKLVEEAVAEAMVVLAAVVLVVTTTEVAAELHPQVVKAIMAAQVHITMQVISAQAEAAAVPARLVEMEHHQQRQSVETVEMELLHQ